MRCADVVVEEKVVDVVAAVEVERVAAGVARETMTGQREKPLIVFVSSLFSKTVFTHAYIDPLYGV